MGGGQPPTDDVKIIEVKRSNSEETIEVHGIEIISTENKTPLFDVLKSTGQAGTTTGLAPSASDIIGTDKSILNDLASVFKNVGELDKFFGIVKDKLGDFANFDIRYYMDIIAMVMESVDTVRKRKERSCFRIKLTSDEKHAITKYVMLRLLRERGMSEVEVEHEINVIDQVISLVCDISKGFYKLNIKKSCLNRIFCCCCS